MEESICFKFQKHNITGCQDIRNENSGRWPLVAKRAWTKEGVRPCSD